MHTMQVMQTSTRLLQIWQVLKEKAKTINLGLMYGMGKNKLMAELGLMKESAEKLIKQYHSKLLL